MSDQPRIDIDGALYEQAITEIRERYEREHPRPSVAPDIAQMLETIANDHAATKFLAPWRLAPYLKGRMLYFRSHLARRGQEEFDNEDFVAHCLMRTFANAGITEQTAWQIVTRHFSK